MVVLLDPYTGQGVQRTTLVNYLLGLPTCKESEFVMKFSKWIELLEQVRSLGCRLPDPAQLWSTFLTFTKSIREERDAVKHYFIQLQLDRATDSFNPEDESRVMEIIGIAATKIRVLLETFEPIKKEQKKPPAPPPNGAVSSHQPTVARADSQQQTPQPSAQQSQTKPVVCLEYIKIGGTCSKGDDCRFKEGHRTPTPEMLAEGQRLTTALARFKSKGKGKGKGGGSGKGKGKSVRGGGVQACALAVIQHLLSKERPFRFSPLQWILILSALRTFRML